MEALKGLGTGLGTIIAAIGFVYGAYLGNKLFRRSGWIGTSEGIFKKRFLYMFFGGLIGMLPGGFLIYGANGGKATANVSDYEAIYNGGNIGNYNSNTGNYNSKNGNLNNGYYDAKSNYNNTYDNTGAAYDYYEDDYYDEGDAGPGSMEYDGYAAGGYQGSSASQFDYLMSLDSSAVLFSEEDLNGLSARELTYLRNSVYARHGYIFNSQELNDFFSGYIWYSPNPGVTTEDVSANEKKNAAMIRNYQDTYGMTYKPQ